MAARRWLARIFGDCLKGRRQDEADSDWMKYKDGTSRMALRPVPYVDISSVHLQPCAPAVKLTASVGGDFEAQDPVQWTETNRLVNAAAAWQIRRLIPVDVATVDEDELVKMTTPELAVRFKSLPVLTVLRAGNEMLRQLPLNLLSTEAFARLKLIERRAIHNVLAERPAGWSDAKLSLYAARERELLEAASEDQRGRWAYESLYSVQLPRMYSAYAPEPRWVE